MSAGHSTASLVPRLDGAPKRVTALKSQGMDGGGTRVEPEGE
jgi:hypothetical protein